jgi:hypothetical protein
MTRSVSASRAAPEFIQTIKTTCCVGINNEKAFIFTQGTFSTDFFGFVFFLPWFEDEGHN